MINDQLLHVLYLPGTVLDTAHSCNYLNECIVTTEETEGRKNSALGTQNKETATAWG